MIGWSRTTVRAGLLAVCGLISVGSFATEGATGSALLAFVNGVPGRTVDVCIGSKEVRSALRYGQWSQARTPAGTRTVTVRVASRGRCTGALIGQTSLVLGAGDTFTLVATARSPQRIVVFDNAGLGVPPPTNVSFAVAYRDASDLGQVSLKLGFSLSAIPPTFPAADPVWYKGASFPVTINGIGSIDPWTAVLVATRPDSPVPLASTAWHGGGAQNVLLEVILVGSSPRNARFVLVRRVTG